MKSRLALAASLVACLVAAPRPAVAEDFVLDPSHTAIIFGISHVGLSYTYGRFNEASGEYTLDADPAACKFEFTIKADSIDTNNKGRDEHLKNADFLNSSEFPLITFVSKKVTTKLDGQKTVYVVTGDMTLHGVAKEITLELTLLGQGPGPGGRDFRSGFLCETKLQRSDFAMTNMIPAIGDEVAITISFEGIRQ
jgi:polyisoprenoid-binding protein YceI